MASFPEAAAQALDRPPRPRYFVKYTGRPAAAETRGSLTPSGEIEAPCDSIDQARNFSMDLVRDGLAHPKSIAIYEKTGFEVMLSCDAFPQPADSPSPVRR